jgi:hypothetical protein
MEFHQAQFHKIQSMENSMDFHGKFHGIPWNSMEFSMEFHGTFYKRLADFFHNIFPMEFH